MARKSSIVRYTAPAAKAPVINIRGPAPIQKTRGRRGGRRRSGGGGGGRKGSAMELAVIGWGYGALVKSGTKLPTIGPLSGIETIAVVGWAMGYDKKGGWVGRAVDVAIVLAAYGRGSGGSAVVGADDVMGHAVGFSD